MKEKYICPECNKEFSRLASLTRHINQTHKKIRRHPSRMLCDICQKTHSKNFIKKHLIDEHNFTIIEAAIYCELHDRMHYDEKISDDIVRQVITRINTEIVKVEKITDLKYYDRQFNSFYNMIMIVESEFSNSFIDLFISKVLPWKLANPGQGNNRDLTKLIYPNDPEKEEILYTKAMLEKNPWYDVHDSRRSPFSMNYIKYDGLTDDLKRAKIREICQFDNPARLPNQKAYWIERGYSEEEAIEEVKKHQNKFSLETCIEKYGEEEGLKRFNERQEKWQNTLKSKPIEEQMRINHSKVYKNGSKSGVEKEFLIAIELDEKFHNVYIKDLGVIVDLIIGNKIVEFYGDYWHCNPKDKRFMDGTMYHPYLKMTAKEKWNFDTLRIEKLIAAGYQVKIVWELDYRCNKDAIIQECKDFINGLRTDRNYIAKVC